jgi:hypothetical protein
MGARASRVTRLKWVNATVLRWYSVDGPESRRQAVRYTIDRGPLRNVLPESVG